MKSYIIKPKSVKSSELVEREYSFSGFSYRFVKSENKNIFLLGDGAVLEKNIKGFEPGSKEYIDFSENHFIRISEMDNSNFTFNITNNTKKIRPVENERKSKFINKGDICYQTASNVGNVCIYDGKKAFYNSHIRKLVFKKNKHYIFAILKSTFGKEQVDVSGSIKGVDNFREEYLLNTKIPFPTTKNHKTPENVISFVTILVQNIINKEELIKSKNKQIDDLIANELKNNQKKVGLSYSYPTISDIKDNNSRIDTGSYEKDFKAIDKLIVNYMFGAINLTDRGFEISRGQNLQISCVGESFYSDYKINDNFYTLILSSKISENSTLIGQKYLGNSKKLKIIKKDDIIFCSRGAQFGRVTIFPEINKNSITNIDNMHISSQKASLEEKIFICQFIRYLRKIKHLYKIAIFGNGSISFTKYQLLDFKFPNFPEPKQKEIAKLYYNPLDKHTDLNLENYLGEEKKRNNSVGIFQLNMEIFILREQLEDLVHKIVKEETIEINCCY
jgi:type I restriction enzyme S subunit